MTISLDWQEYFEQFKESGNEDLHFDATDEQDMTRHYTGRCVEGWLRWIQLREGMFMLIEKTHNRDRLLLDVRESYRALAWYFILRGKKKNIRSEEHTSELQSQSTISYAVFCLKKKKEKKRKK